MQSLTLIWLTIGGYILLTLTLTTLTTIWVRYHLRNHATGAYCLLSEKPKKV